MPKQAKEKRQERKRVAFENPIESSAVAIDGTWIVKGRLADVSDSGAKFRPTGKVNDRLRKEEFFLIMTSDGSVHRRCKIVWEVKGNLGLRFIAVDAN